MHIPLPAIQALQALVGPQNVQTDEVSLWLHAYDCSLSRMRPDIVVHIPSADLVAPVVQVLNRFRLPFVARAAATNHAGSCSTPLGGVVLNLSGLNRILQINTQERYALVEPGVITGQLQEALAPLGFFYAPDPASERVCTLGGNMAQNASGARCLKYGSTLDHILEAQCVLPTGETCVLSRQDTGTDGLGLLTGSEGTLGIITQLKIKILPIVPHLKTFLATFPSLEDCVQTVTDLIGKGITPRCMEAMDQLTAQTIEDFAHVGYPTDAAASLLLELEGSPEQIQQEEVLFSQLCQQNHVQKLYPALREKDRLKIWQGRQTAYAAMARLAPNVLVCDGTVPRSELPRTLRKVRHILEENQVRASLLFHAGDGNFHPQIIFDERNRWRTQQINQVAKLILRACVEAGGTISGEHGIGTEKRSSMLFQYDTPTLDLFSRLKHALDPNNLANPSKIIPVGYREKASVPTPIPSTVRQLTDRLQQLIAQKKPFYVTGNNSVFHLPKEHLSAQALDQVIDIDRDNYTVTAQAGISVKQLLRILSKQGLFFALPPTAGTLGGAFSSGCFPDFYSHVIGIEALLPDASYVRYGGKITKNATGYNLIRLFAGAQGSLGLVTQLTFKVYAKPLDPIICKPAKPLQKTILWRKIKEALDPNRLFQYPQEKPA